MVSCLTPPYQLSDTARGKKVCLQESNLTPEKKSLPAQIAGRRHDSCMGCHHHTGAKLYEATVSFVVTLRHWSSVHVL